MTGSIRGGGRRLLGLSKTGAMPVNPQVFAHRAAAFAAGAARSRRGWCATLLVCRDGEGLRSFVVMPGWRQSAELELAHAVGARLDPVDGLPVLESPAVGWLEAHGQAGLARATQAGAEPAEVSRVLANVLPTGGWVGVSLRQPSRREQRAHLVWVQHQLGSQTPTHHSRQSHAVTVSIAGGGQDGDQVRAVLAQVSAVLPGFDVSTRVPVFSVGRVRVRRGVAAGVAAGVGAGLVSPAVTDSWQHLTTAGVAGDVLSWAPDVVSQVVEAGPAWVAAGAGLCTIRHGVRAVFAAAGSWPGRWLSAARHAGLRAFPSPPYRAGRPRPPQPDQQADSGGEYPLHPATFLVGAEVVAGLVAPQAGAVSGADETRARQVPPPLTGDTGGQGWQLSQTEEGWPVVLAMGDGRCEKRCRRPG